MASVYIITNNFSEFGILRVYLLVYYNYTYYISDKQTYHMQMLKVIQVNRKESDYNSCFCKTVLFTPSVFSKNNPEVSELASIYIIWSAIKVIKLFAVCRTRMCLMILMAY